MRLTEFIHANHESIIEDWVAFARTLLPWAEGMDERGLRDHAEELLTAVVKDMQSPQTLVQQSEKSKGKTAQGALANIGRKHAAERVQTGISLDQLVSEFRALRASVLRQWEKTQRDTDGDMTRFNEALDETLAESTTRYMETVKTTRDQFLGILGHDLRNPIGSILMGSELLISSDDSETVEVGTIMRNSAKRMSRMVNDLLDLTRSSLGSGIPVFLKPTDLSAVCGQVIAELQAMYPNAQLHFQAKGDLLGHWDSDRLSQAVSNLIGNAIQYGDIEKPIIIRVEDRESTVTIEVHNEGPEIPESALNSIFLPMARHMPGGQMDESNQTGIGLGLYITCEIVKSHSGTIKVESSREGGTCFAVCLPRQTS